MARNDRKTPLQCLEGWEGTDEADPAMLAHLNALLAEPEEQPALLAAEKRLALTNTIHARLCAASAAALATHDVLQKIA